MKNIKNGYTEIEIAKKYNVSRETIINRVKEYEQKSGDILLKHYKKKELPVEEIIEQWKSGISQEKLAEKYGVSRDTIGSRIREYKVKSGQEIPKVRIIKHVPTEEIVNDWLNGLSYRKLEAKYGVSKNTIIDRIKAYEKESGTEISKPVTNRNRSSKVLPMDEIINDWKSGDTYNELAKKYGVSRTLIITRIKEYKEKTGDNRTINSTMRKTVTTVNKYTRNETTKTNKQNNDKITNDSKPQNKIRIGIIWREYKDGLSVVNLALKYKMTVTEMKTKLDQYQALLLTKSYVDLNKSIAELARETKLTIIEVKEKIKTVLRKEVKTVPIDWYLRLRVKGYTEERILKEYILLTRKKAKNNPKNIKNDEEQR